MYPEKQERTLRWMALMPLSVGSRAVLLSGGRVIWTSRVVSIQTQTEEELCFETLNTRYRVTMEPLPYAAAAEVPLRVAA